MPFLRALKTDLVEKRLWLVLAGAAVALAAALVLLHGGGSAATLPLPKPPAAVVSLPGSGPVAVTAAAPNPEQAASETPAGSAYQRQGNARNPFAPLAAATTAPAAAKTAAQATTVSGAATKAAGSTGGTPASGTSSTSGSSSTKGSSVTVPSTTPAATPAPTVEETTYRVSMSFGRDSSVAAVVSAPDATGVAGSTGPLPASLTPATAASSLKSYRDVPRLLALPDTAGAVVDYLGVAVRTKDLAPVAMFVVLGETIPRGQGTCVPSATQCNVVELKSGQSEVFDGLSSGSANGGLVHYRLKLSSIKAHLESSVAAASSYNRRESRFGRELLTGPSAPVLDGLSYSPSLGLLLSKPGSTLADIVGSFAPVLTAKTARVAHAALVPLPGAQAGPIGG